MKFWQMVTWCEPGQLVEVASIAEACGFEGVMGADHAFFPKVLESPYPYSADGTPPIGPDSPYPDPWVSTMAMAAATTRLKFSHAVYILPIHHPVEVAKATAALSLYTGGRFILGAGLGWMREEYEVFGVPWRRRGAILDEYLELLPKLWRGEWVGHSGEHFGFEPLCICPPAPAPIPVWLGGASDVALRRAARIADGWIGAGNHPDEVPAILAKLSAMRDTAGTAGRPFETVIGLTTPPGLDTFRRLAEHGMTAGVSYPFRFALGERSSLDDKRRYMETFAETIIRHF